MQDHHQPEQHEHPAPHALSHSMSTCPSPIDHLLTTHTRSPAGAAPTPHARSTHDRSARSQRDPQRAPRCSNTSADHPRQTPEGLAEHHPDNDAPAEDTDQHHAGPTPCTVQSPPRYRVTGTTPE